MFGKAFFGVIEGLAEALRPLFPSLAGSIIGASRALEQSFTSGIEKIKKNLGDLVTPDLTSDLVKDLDNAELSLVEIQNTIDKLSNQNDKIFSDEAEAQLKRLTKEAQELERASKAILKARSIEIGGFQQQAEQIDAPGLQKQAVDKKDLDLFGLPSDEAIQADLKRKVGLAQVAVTNGGSELRAELKRIGEETENLAFNSLAPALSGIGDAIAGALINGTSVLGALGSSLLQSLGQFLSNFADKIIQFGITAVAFGKLQLALASNPFTTIGAGLAGIASGLALKAIAGVVSNAGQVGGGGGADIPSGTSGGFGTGGTQTSSRSTTFQGGGGGRVVFEIAGTKLIGVLQNTANSQQRVGGGQQLSIG